MALHLRRAGLIVYDGQSWVISPSAGEGFPNHVTPALNPAERAWVDYTVAISGTSYAYRETNVAPLYESVYNNKVTGPHVMIDCAGQAELTADMSAADLLDEVETYHAARKAAGFDYTVAHTHPPANAYTSPQNTERLAYNALILASTVVDAVADLASVPELQDPNDADYWLLDHPTALGAEVFATEYLAALATIGIV